MRHDDARLWAIALVGSLFLALLIFLAAAAAVGLLPLVLKSPRPSPEAAVTPEPPASVLISPEMLQAIPAKSSAASAPALPPRAAAPDFTRTAEDQRGKRPDKPAFIGERDTQATSDRTPDPSAKPLPSQRGEKPRNAEEVETTESKYRDGPLKENAASPTDPAMAAAPAIPPTPEIAPAESSAAAQIPPAPPAKNIGEKETPEAPKPAELAQGPNPVDVNVPKPMPAQSPPPTPPAPQAENTAKISPDQKPPAPRKPIRQLKDPAFAGNQRKTAISGSITRNGRSALDVADSPLGRYQAALSRAVEQEWQRNCVRHRDFITPGFLTVRFFVEASGKVKSVQFVGDMQTGEVQKGFTLNSIRDAEIPPMPKELKADYAEEPLELIFNFFF